MLSGEAAITNVQSIIRPEWIEPTMFCTQYLRYTNEDGESYDMLRNQKVTVVLSCEATSCVSSQISDALR
jgi:hypothetical protein